MDGVAINGLGRPPSALRRLASNGGAAATSEAGITLRLGYVPPYDWDAMMAFFAGRAIEGVEVVEARRYRRTIEIGGRHGTIEIRPLEKRNALVDAVTLDDAKRVAKRLWGQPFLTVIVGRVSHPAGN